MRQGVTVFASQAEPTSVVMPGLRYLQPRVPKDSLRSSRSSSQNTCIPAQQFPRQRPLEKCPWLSMLSLGIEGQGSEKLAWVPRKLAPGFPSFPDDRNAGAARQTPNHQVPSLEAVVLAREQDSVGLTGTRAILLNRKVLEIITNKPNSRSVFSPWQEVSKSPCLLPSAAQFLHS